MIIARFLAALVVGLLPAGSDLFPSGKGSIWEYRVVEGGQTGTSKATVTTASVQKGVRSVTIAWTVGKHKVREETYEIDAAGVRRSRGGAEGDVGIEPGIPLIKNPMQVGKSWEWSGTVEPASGPSRKATAKIKVTARETISTQAGRFEAFRVDLKLLVAGEDVTPAIYWFAPGVGLVKEYTASRTADNKKFEITGMLARYTLK